jgi:hypothetical protein
MKAIARLAPRWTVAIIDTVTVDDDSVCTVMIINYKTRCTATL